MTRALLLLLILLTGGGEASARQQVSPGETPGAASAPSAPLPPVAQEPSETDEIRVHRDAVRVGSPYHLPAGSDAGAVVVVMGDATIEGHVRGDVAVVMGDLQLGPAAVIDGDVAVVGGSATAADGASARGEFVVVGGTLEAPAGFLPEGEHVIVGNPHLGGALRQFMPWVTQGLLWGRVIVPGIAWNWWLVAISSVVYLALVLLFPGAIRSVAEMLVSRPLGALFAGLLTLLLFPPVVAVMAITVVGALVVPFVVFAMFVGGALGKTAVFASIGRGVAGPLDPEARLRGMLAVALGLVVAVVLYVIPVIGLLAWTTIGVLGLGAASLTAFTAMRRERAARVSARTPTTTNSPASGAPATFAGDEPAQASVVGAPAADERAQDVSLGTPPLPPPPSAAVLGSLIAYPRATFLDRLAAGALDVLLVAVAVEVLDLRLGPFGNPFFMLLIYAIAFWAWKGTTVGGIVVGLRVVRLDGSALRPVDAVVRGLSSLLSVAALGLGFFWILLQSNRDRQAWHDLIAGTVVVRVPRDLALP